MHADGTTKSSGGGQKVAGKRGGGPLVTIHGERIRSPCIDNGLFQKKTKLKKVKFSIPPFDTAARIETCRYCAKKVSS